MNKIQIVSRRFVKAFISGFITGVSVITLGGTSQWSDFSHVINGFFIAGVFGGINGVLMAVEKWASYTEVV